MGILFLAEIRSTKGFTIAELMIVIAIIGIISAVSMPNIFRWRQDHQLNSATRSIQAIIQKLRLCALKEKSTTEIEFHSLSNEYVAKIYMRGAQKTKVKTAKYELPPGIRIQKITFSMNMLKFNSRGLPSGGAGSVFLCNQCGTVRKIVVPITGNSRISL